jgi:DNA-binding NarL/FixJ family response regulator
MTESPIRVGIVDDQPLIRQGLRYVINAQTDMRVVGEAGDGREAIELARAHRPNVLLMDVQMPNYNGLDATRDILQILPDCKIVILTTFDLEDYVYDGIRSGAVGYLLKDATPEELLDAIYSAHRGESIFRTAIAAKVIAQAFNHKDELLDDISLDANIVESFTERELEVLQQMAYGLRNDQIAHVLHIRESTVKTHVHRVLQKFRVEDRTQAVVFAIRNRIVR